MIRKTLATGMQLSLAFFLLAGFVGGTSLLPDHVPGQKAEALVLPGTQLVSTPASLPGAATVSGSAASADEPDIHVRLLADKTAVAPGSSLRLGVDIKLPPGWHVYYREPGDTGRPTTIEWELPAGFTASDLMWQRPNKYTDFGFTTYGYRDRTTIASTVTVPDDVAPGQTVTLKAHITWLACKESCIPGEADLELTLPVVAATSAVNPANTDRFQSVDFSGTIEDLEKPVDGKDSILDRDLDTVEGASGPSSLWVYLGLAFLGGLILNFMPCVLPVISLKIFGFVKQANDEPAKVFRHGLVYTAGTLMSFLALAIAVVAMQQTGYLIGWGFQFQSPVFLVFMCTLLLVLSLSLFGLFFVNVSSGPKQLDEMSHKKGYTGTFFTGVLATILATPCSAPFLGTALGFAFSQPWFIILSIFLSVGMGMSFPYLVLTARPGWLKFIPKPGAWMEHLKEGMGFILLATVVWFLWVLGTQIGLAGLVWVIAYLLVVGFATWLVSRFAGYNAGKGRKRTVWIIAVGFAVAAFFTMVNPNLDQPAMVGDEQSLNNGGSQSRDSIAWESFSVDKLDRHIADGKTVFIDFTAEWCLTCKANELTAVNTRAVKEKLEQLNAVALKADWTSKDPEITKMLNKLGRSGVPLYVIFPADRPTEPIVLPELITKQMLIDALDRAGPSRK